MLTFANIHVIMQMLTCNITGASPLESEVVSLLIGLKLLRNIWHDDMSIRDVRILAAAFCV